MGTANIYRIAVAGAFVAPTQSRGERIRTSDHLNPIQVRYQAALHPVALT